MKYLLIILTILCSTCTYAQVSQYIVFEEHTLLDTVKIPPFKVLYNHVVIDGKNKEKSSLNIFNIYFSKYNFNAAGLDSKAFFKSNTDYRAIGNDLLLTLTPLTDSLNQKMRKLTLDEVGKLHIVKTDDILQNLIRNLYRCFTENTIAKDDIPGIIKTMKYKMLIKKGRNYYEINAPVLTEYYLIDKANYLFPDQYHYGEINMATSNQTQYYDALAIKTLLLKYKSNIINNYYPLKTVIRRIFPSATEMQDGFNAQTFWTYPFDLGGILGIGKFQFIEGIGIVNGTYGQYFDKSFLITLENDDSIKDFHGEFKMGLNTINGIKLKSFKSKKDAKTGQIIAIE